MGSENNMPSTNVEKYWESINQNTSEIRKKCIGEDITLCM